MRNQRQGKAPLSCVILRTECLWFLLSDWKLYNKSQVTCCSWSFLASVDRIKIQSGMLLRHASRIILQLPSTVGWACLARRVCACAFLAFLMCRFYKSNRNFLHVNQHCSTPQSPVLAVSKEESSCLRRPNTALSKTHFATYSVHSSHLGCPVSSPLAGSVVQNISIA